MFVVRILNLPLSLTVHYSTKLRWPFHHAERSTQSLKVNVLHMM